MHVDWFTVFAGLTGGLALFLYGMNVMGDTLQEVAGDRMQQILARFTCNRFAGIGTGMIACSVLDSSSATAIITIALVHAGILSFVAAIGVVMGANIGTTLSSVIIASGLIKYSAFVLMIGLLFKVLGRATHHRRWGAVTLGLGLILFGLFTIEHAAEPLRDYPPIEELLARMDNPLLGVFAGALVTAIIQSSSATVGIVIVLAGRQMLTPEAGVAIMLGAEIGTCANVLVASIGRSREAVRVGLFQLLFNTIAVLVFIGFVGPLAQFSAWMVGSDPGIASQPLIAAAHVIFNVASVLMFLPFVPATARVLAWLVPDRTPNKPPPRPRPCFFPKRVARE